MKFIKTIGGYFINVHKIESLWVETCSNGFIVGACIGANRYPLKYFECTPLQQPEVKAEAQAWLDNFVAELNGEKSNAD